MFPLIGNLSRKKTFAVIDLKRDRVKRLHIAEFLEDVLQGNLHGNENLLYRGWYPSAN